MGRGLAIGVAPRPERVGAVSAGAGVVSSAMIEYAAMTAADLAEARALWVATEGMGLRGADAPAELERYLGRNPGLSVVARERGALVGAILCGHDGRRGFLYHLTDDGNA